MDVLYESRIVTEGVDHLDEDILCQSTYGCDEFASWILILVDIAKFYWVDLEGDHQFICDHHLRKYMNESDAIINGYVKVYPVK